MTLWRLQIPPWGDCLLHPASHSSSLSSEELCPFPIVSGPQLPYSGPTHDPTWLAPKIIVSQRGAGYNLGVCVIVSVEAGDTKPQGQYGASSGDVNICPVGINRMTCICKCFPPNQYICVPRRSIKRWILTVKDGALNTFPLGEVILHTKQDLTIQRINRLHIPCAPRTTEGRLEVNRKQDK